MSKKSSITILALGIIAGVALSLGSGVLAQRDQKAQLPTEELRAFTEVFDRIKKNYVEEIDDKTLIENAIRGMLSGLDPHSTYLDETTYKDLQEGTKGEFYNGIIVGWEDGIDIDHSKTWEHAGNGGLMVDHCIFYDNHRNFKEDDSLQSLETFMTQTMQHNIISPASSPVVTPYNFTSPNYKPQNEALGGAKTPTDPWFTTVSFRGGVDPNDDWTEGWTIHDEN